MRIYFYLDSFLWLPAQLGFYFCTKVIHGHFTGFYVGDQEEGVISGGVGVCVCVGWGGGLTLLSEVENEYLYTKLVETRTK